jgi:predicted transcriptional regulator
MDEDQLDLTFQALASQARREILATIRSNPGCNLQLVASQFEMSRIGVMKHLDVLEAANLIVSDRVGRERLLYFNAIPIQQIYEMWTDDYSRSFAGRLTRLKINVEKERSKP